MISIRDLNTTKILNVMIKKKIIYPIVSILMVLLLYSFSFAINQKTDLTTENVFIIVGDGFRWQEMFTGAELALIKDEQYVEDEKSLMQSYWHEDHEIRREKLLPFFWNVIAEKGQIIGNRKKGSRVDVTNSSRGSYPGYNEILTGFFDDYRVITNFPINNPNWTVMDFFNEQEELRDSIGVVASWWAFTNIVNQDRSGIDVIAGPQSSQPAIIPQPDSLTHTNVMTFLQEQTPRIAMLVYDDTDNIAHEGEYDAYLDACHRFDGNVKELWQFVQSHPKYRNRTTFIITADHGRGTEDQWTTHGSGAKHSNETWIAVLGPDTPSLGEIESGSYYLNQIAATSAAFMGLNYQNERRVGGIIEKVFKNIPHKVYETTSNTFIQSPHDFSEDEIMAGARAYANAVKIQRQTQQETPWIPDKEKAKKANKELQDEVNRAIVQTGISLEGYQEMIRTLRSDRDLQEDFFEYVDKYR